MEKLIEARNETAAIVNGLMAVENRSEAQNAELDAAMAKFETLTAEIDRQEKAAAINNVLAQPKARISKPGAVTAPKAGALSLDQFVRAVATNPEQIRAAATTFGNETTGADGGYAVPAEYSRTLETLLKGPESIVSLCDNITTLGNSIVLPVDEDPVWSAAGIQPADVAEGAAYGQTKPVIKQLTITLAKTGVIVPVSEEMLQDGVNIGAYVAQKSADKLQWKMNAKAMTAFLASGGLITVAKTGGAAAGSAPDLANVMSMWNSIPAQFRDSAVWIANPRLQTALMSLVIGQMPVFVPGGSLSNRPFDTLLGRPIIWSELCAAVGTVGDLCFVAPKLYYAVTKGAPQAAVSGHIWFDQDITAYKTSVRMAVKSKLSAVITRPDATTVGNCAVLATR